MIVVKKYKARYFDIINNIDPCILVHGPSLVRDQIRKFKLEIKNSNVSIRLILKKLFYKYYIKERVSNEKTDISDNLYIISINNSSNILLLINLFKKYKINLYGILVNKTFSKDYSIALKTLFDTNKMVGLLLLVIIRTQITIIRHMISVKN